MVPKIVDMLKSSSRKVRCKALETLRIVVEEDSDNKVVTGLLDVCIASLTSSLNARSAVVNVFSSFCRKYWVRGTLCKQ